MEGLFGLGHIIFLVLSILLMIFGLLFIKKKNLNEEKINKLVKISALALLVAILVNRISITIFDVVINKRDGYTWWNLIPNSYCGMSSLLLSLAIVLGKKDNKVLHFIAYLGFIGGVVTMLYPDFLESQSFLDIRSITGLLHHTIMVWIVLLIITTRYMVPTMKKWKIAPIGFAFLMMFGVFLQDALHFQKSMQIGEPFIKSLPFLTSWYFLGIISFVIFISFLYYYDLKVNKIKKEDIKKAFFEI